MLITGLYCTEAMGISSQLTNAPYTARVEDVPSYGLIGMSITYLYALWTRWTDQ